MLRISLFLCTLFCVISSISSNEIEFRVYLKSGSILEEVYADFLTYSNIAEEPTFDLQTKLTNEIGQQNTDKRGFAKIKFDSKKSYGLMFFNDYYEACHVGIPSYVIDEWIRNGKSRVLILIENYTDKRPAFQEKRQETRGNTVEIEFRVYFNHAGFLEGVYADFLTSQDNDSSFDLKTKIKGEKSTDKSGIVNINFDKNNIPSLTFFNQSHGTRDSYVAAYQIEEYIRNGQNIIRVSLENSLQGQGINYLTIEKMIKNAKKITSSNEDFDERVLRKICELEGIIKKLKR